VSLEHETRSIDTASHHTDALGSASHDGHPSILDEDELFTPGEAAERLKVSTEQVRTLIRHGRLAAINVGTGPKRPLYRIPAQALQDFLSSRHQPGPAVRPHQFKRRPPVHDHFPNLR